MTNRLNFRTQSQNRDLHRLRNKLKLPHDVWEDLVNQYTGGRSTSSKDMKIFEADNMIDSLKRLEREHDLKHGFGKQEKKPIEDTPENVMRRKIFAKCHEIRWRNDAGKVDQERLNAWMLKYSYLKKPLQKYTLKELPKLISQFEKMVEDFYAKR